MFLKISKSLSWLLLFSQGKERFVLECFCLQCHFFDLIKGDMGLAHLCWRASWWRQ